MRQGFAIALLVLGGAAVHAQDVTFTNCSWSDDFPATPEVKLVCPSTSEKGKDETRYTRVLSVGRAECTANYKTHTGTSFTEVYCGVDAEGKLPSRGAQKCLESENPSFNMERLDSWKKLTTEPELKSNIGAEDVSGARNCTTIHTVTPVTVKAQCKTSDDLVEAPAVCQIFARCTAELTKGGTETNRVLGAVCNKESDGKCPATMARCLALGRPVLDPREMAKMDGARITKGRGVEHGKR